MFNILIKKTFLAIKYRNSAFFFNIEASTVEHMKSKTTVTHDVISIRNQTILGIYFYVIVFSLFQIMFDERKLFVSFR